MSPTGDLAGSRALVTGGSGFIGSHLVEALLAAGCARVAVVDNFFIAENNNLGEALRRHPDALHLYREDASDLRALADIVTREQPSLAFNLATVPLLYSFDDPADACRTGLDIALALAECLRLGLFERLVHVSSSEVYGTARYTPMDEDHPLLAETTYAAGKASADLALASYVRMYGLNIVTARPFNNFGPRQNDLSYAGVVPLTIRRILAGEPPVIEGDGAQTRDFIFVRDTVTALVALAQMEGSAGSVFNIASGKESSIRDLVLLIAKLMDFRGEPRYAPARPADVHRHLAGVAKAEALLGPLATTPQEEALATTIDWYRASEVGSSCSP